MKLIQKKSLGQNFLIDNVVIQLIAEAGSVNKNDNIIEVGPGNGVLTEKLFEKKPQELIVIEKDIRLVKILKEKFRDNITILNEDMMKVSYENYFKNNLIISFIIISNFFTFFKWKHA